MTNRSSSKLDKPAINLMPPTVFTPKHSITHPSTPSTRTSKMKVRSDKFILSDRIVLNATKAKTLTNRRLSTFAKIASPVNNDICKEIYNQGSISIGKPFQNRKINLIRVRRTGSVDMGNNYSSGGKVKGTHSRPGDDSFRDAIDDHPEVIDIQADTSNTEFEKIIDKFSTKIIGGGQHSDSWNAATIGRLFEDLFADFAKSFPNCEDKLLKLQDLARFLQLPSRVARKEQSVKTRAIKHKVLDSAKSFKKAMTIDNNTGNLGLVQDNQPLPPELLSTIHRESHSSVAKKSLALHFESQQPLHPVIDLEKQTQSGGNSPKKFQTCLNIPKLDLQGISEKTKGYNDEFLEKIDGFSESWKRECMTMKTVDAEKSACKSTKSDKAKADNDNFKLSL